MMKNLRLIFSSLALALFASSAFAQTLFLVQEPSNLSGTYDFTDSFTADGWGADLDTTAVTAVAAFAYDDGTYVDPVNGAAGDTACCGPILNTGDVAGKIAFIYRGACNFSLKAYQAQAAGAVGCVIVNNEPGNLVNMLGGDSASAIVIPTVFVSDATGAALADSINEGSVEIFLGNPNGVFTNNIGAYKGNVSTANAGAIPVEFAQSSSDFSVPVGAWIFNYGSADAINAILSVNIDRDGTEVYNESSTGATILPGDSVFVSLDTYSEDGYEAGLYTMTYNMVSDASDELPVDNEVVTTFYINEEGMYSKSSIDPIDGPSGAGGLRPLEETEYQWCIVLNSENAESVHALGMTFATLSNEEVSLAGNYAILSVYEWNDPITTTVSFDDLVELTSEIYDYSEDLQGEFVTYTFEDPVELVNDQNYLGCVTIENDNIFLVTDDQSDYRTTADSYPNEIFFPLNGDAAGDWFGGGFGLENVPAIIMNLGEPNGIAEDVERLEITPYPNPTVDRINIPLGIQLNGDLTVDVYNVAGALVMSENICQKGSNLQMDVTTLSSGLHNFNLTFQDKTSTSFQVMIAR